MLDHSFQPRIIPRPRQTSCSRPRLGGERNLLTGVGMACNANHDADLRKARHQRRNQQTRPEPAQSPAAFASLDAASPSPAHPGQTSIVAPAIFEAPHSFEQHYALLRQSAVLRSHWASVHNCHGGLRRNDGGTRTPSSPFVCVLTPVPPP
jgi:hypothetical protein